MFVFEAPSTAAVTMSLRRKRSPASLDAGRTKKKATRSVGESKRSVSSRTNTHWSVPMSARPSTASNAQNVTGRRPCLRHSISYILPQLIIQHRGNVGIVSQPLAFSRLGQMRPVFVNSESWCGSVALTSTICRCLLLFSRSSTPPSVMSLHTEQSGLVILASARQRYWFSCVGFWQRSCCWQRVERWGGYCAHVVED
eukprot:1889227-Rhodomonas_salina.3